MAYTIAFFGTKPYDESSFNDKNKEFGFEIRYYKGHLNKNNVLLTQGVDAVCIFVNDIADAEVLRIMASNGVKLLALRCAGFNNVDLMGIFIRVILIVCVFIYLSSFFYIITRYDEYFVDEEVKEENKSVDSTTFKMVLTSLNVIYLVFCIIQINSLFMQKTNINYADYARQGFFQLMVVSVINLIVIFCLLYTSPTPRDGATSRMPSSA